MENKARNTTNTTVGTIGITKLKCFSEIKTGTSSEISKQLRKEV